MSAVPMADMDMVEMLGNGYFATEYMRHYATHSRRRTCRTMAGRAGPWLDVLSA